MHTCTRPVRAESRAPCGSLGDMTDTQSEDGGDAFRVAIVRFDSTDRVGQNGVPGVLLFSAGQRIVVTSHKETKRNQWAKVRLIDAAPPDGEASKTMLRAELVEILGPVGDFAAELHAYQVHFSILPCRYPPSESWSLLPPPDPEALDGRLDCTHLHVLSIDNASTRDIDDALSFEFPGAAPAPAPARALQRAPPRPPARPAPLNPAPFPPCRRPCRWRRRRSRGRRSGRARRGLSRARRGAVGVRGVHLPQRGRARRAPLRSLRHPARPRRRRGRRADDARPRALPHRGARRGRGRARAGLVSALCVGARTCQLCLPPRATRGLGRGQRVGPDAAPDARARRALARRGPAAPGGHRLAGGRRPPPPPPPETGWPAPERRFANNPLRPSPPPETGGPAPGRRFANNPLRPPRVSGRGRRGGAPLAVCPPPPSLPY